MHVDRRRARRGRDRADRQDAVRARRRPTCGPKNWACWTRSPTSSTPCRNQVRVEGHTDNLPIHTARFPSNWELSATRATTVLRYFEARGSRRQPPGGRRLRRPAPHRPQRYGRRTAPGTAASKSSFCAGTDGLFRGLGACPPLLSPNLRYKRQNCVAQAACKIKSACRQAKNIRTLTGFLTRDS